MKSKRLIIVYDGCCSMCSLFVRWLSFVNKKKKLSFVSQQNYTVLFPDSIVNFDQLNLNDQLVVIRNRSLFTGAKAVLEILREKGGGYIWLVRLLQLFPQTFLDKIYNWVAHHRYRFLGRRKSCSIRSPLP